MLYKRGLLSRFGIPGYWRYSQSVVHFLSRLPQFCTNRWGALGAWHARAANRAISWWEARCNTKMRKAQRSGTYVVLLFDMKYPHSINRNHNRPPTVKPSAALALTSFSEPFAPCSLSILYTDRLMTICKPKWTEKFRFIVLIRHKPLHFSPRPWKQAVLEQACQGKYASLTRVPKAGHLVSGLTSLFPQYSHISTLDCSNTAKGACESFIWRSR